MSYMRRRRRAVASLIENVRAQAVAERFRG